MYYVWFPDSVTIYPGAFCHIKEGQKGIFHYPLHCDSAEISRFAAETCFLMSKTNRLFSLSHGETDGISAQAEGGHSQKTSEEREREGVAPILML